MHLYKNKNKERFSVADCQLIMSVTSPFPTQVIASNEPGAHLNNAAVKLFFN